jgi:hypothetical protein
MSSTSVVAATGPATSTPQWGRRQRLLALMVGAPGSSAPIGPTCGFAVSPNVGSGASVGTLKIGYPRIQALSQDKEQDVHPCAAT